MKQLGSWVVAALVGLGVGMVVAQDSGAPAAEPQQSSVSENASLSEAEQREVRALVRDTLLENPEILIDALRIYEQRQRQAEADRVGQALTTYQDALTNDPGDPVMGNPDGDVVVVEFFDYNCPYCRKVAEPLREAVEADGNIKLVMKEWPILGPESYFAARAALAAKRQNAYERFHFAMMERSGKLTQEQVLSLAESLGLDMARLQADMKSPEIDEQLQSVYDLADALGITGTPAFVVGEQLLPGAVPMSRLEQAVAAARDDG